MLARLFRTGFYPQGSNERFQGVSYIRSSFPKLTQRKDITDFDESFVGDRDHEA